MIETFIAFCAFLGGMAAHLTDPLVRQFPPRWELLSRYVIGVITIFLFFVAFMRRLRVGAIRDGVVSFVMSSWFVALGVVVATWLDEKLTGVRA